MNVIISTRRSVSITTIPSAATVVIIGIVVIVNTCIDLLATLADQLTDPAASITDFNHTGGFLSTITNYFTSVAFCV